MNTKLKSIILLSVIGSVSIASAAVISPEESWKRMTGSAMKAFSSKGRLPELQHTVEDNGEPTVYIFNANGSTWYLSADNEVTALLGYSEEHHSLNDVSPAFDAWLNAMSREITMVREGAKSRTTLDTRGNDFAPVAPLCTTKWSQDAPFYDDCPKPMRAEHNCYTGCVATAMAQVMKYHNWPVSGEGSIGYRWQTGNRTLRLDFTDETYDWANMIDVYNQGEYSEAQGAAVANLMKSCGYAVEMSYGTESSGAQSQRIAGALGKYFKYDKSAIRYLLRDYYSLDEWETIIYESLKTYGPVILDGQSNQGGHSFVCDGYDSDGYFHINWGWRGVSDGYYLLSVLDPFDQGIGGSGDNSGFDYMQDAITGITPAKGDNPADSWIGQLYSFGEFGIDTTVNYTPGEPVGPFCIDGVYNFGPAVIPAGTEIGLLFRNEISGEDYIDPSVLEGECDILFGFANIIMEIPVNIEDGKYLVTLSYRTPQEISTYDTRSIDNGWIDVRFPFGMTASYKATVSDGIVTLEDSSWRPSGIENLSGFPKDSNIHYYNLQGMEIKAPRKGELVIMKRGKDMRKIIF